MRVAANDSSRQIASAKPLSEPSTTERSRITNLFIAATGARALVVCGPVGSGKTTATRHYLKRVEGSAYVRFSATTSIGEAEAMLADTLNASEVAIDDLDAAAPDVVEALLERIARGIDARRYILIGKSRSRMRAHRLIASGLATTIDAPSLAFNRTEVADLAAAFGADHDDESIVQLIHDTEGWAIAIAWIVRDAADARRSLHGAAERWIENRAYLLLELLAAEHERDRATFNTFRAHLRGCTDESHAELEECEALGLPVVRTRQSFRPYRLLSRMCSSTVTAHESLPSTPLMTLNALGCFRCEIGGRALEFRRRRDRNILTYVALAPEGRVSRKQLIDAFWPNADRSVATQGLRTTLSRIRLAIADIVGSSRVDEYFRSSEDVSTNFANVAFDARRFVDGVRRGDIEYARGSMESAERYYAATDRIYRGSLLATEAVESCFAAHVSNLEETYVETLVRRVQLYTAAKEYSKARTCACNLLERAQDEALRLRTMGFFDAIRFATA